LKLIVCFVGKEGLIWHTQHPKGAEGLEKIQDLEESLRRQEGALPEGEEGHPPVFTSQVCSNAFLRHLGQINHIKEPHNCSATQDTPHFLWSLKVKHHFHKTVPEASNPHLHILLIYFNIILPSTPRSGNWSPVFMSSEQNVGLICDCLHAFIMPLLAPSLLI
jgi:hypothetical protein